MTSELRQCNKPLFILNFLPVTVATLIRPLNLGTLFNRTTKWETTPGHASLYPQFSTSASRNSNRALELKIAS